VRNTQKITKKKKKKKKVAMHLKKPHIHIHSSSKQNSRIQHLCTSTTRAREKKWKINGGGATRISIFKLARAGGTSAELRSSALLQNLDKILIMVFQSLTIEPFCYITHQPPSIDHI
jgi:hypothetical protein